MRCWLVFNGLFEFLLLGVLGLFIVVMVAHVICVLGFIWVLGLSFSLGTRFCLGLNWWLW